MRMVNYDGRLALEVDGRIHDVEQASGGRFGPDVQAVYSRWAAFKAWADSADLASDQGHEVEAAKVGPPVPTPPQVFAVGINYKAHAEEAGLDLPIEPFVFTKFPAAIAGPYDVIGLPSDNCDYEAELVAVISERADRISTAEAWDHVAGLTVGQDLSDRGLQLSGPPPQQYNLGKSFRGFAPIGPALVTPDEFADPDDLLLTCSLPEGERQRTRTSDLIFPVAHIIAYLSQILPLLPGDVIFTGTPSGIGWTAEPRRTFTEDDVLVTTVEGIGEMRHTFRHVDYQPVIPAHAAADR